MLFQQTWAERIFEGKAGTDVEADGFLIIGQVALLFVAQLLLLS